MTPQAGIAIDALAIRVQMGQGDKGRSTRDLMALSDLLDRYATLDKPIAVTAAGVPSDPPPAPADNGEPAGDPGFWRSPWSPETQARWLTQALTIAAAKPYVQSVCWQDLYDSPAGEMRAGGLVSDTGTLKPAAGALAELRKLIRGAPRSAAATR